MVNASYLVDTSALVRILADTEDQLGWFASIEAGLLGVCDITELELLYSATSRKDRDRLLSVLDELFVWIPMLDTVFAQARQIQQLLTDRGLHRSAGPVDLQLAATALANRLTILHYDRDFLTVAEITGQPVAWVASPGSL